MKSVVRPAVSRANKPSRGESIVLAVILALACQYAGSFAFRARAADPPTTPEKEGRLQAILVGIGDYRRAPRLCYAANDVRQLAMTLRERGNYDVVEIVDSARTDQSQSESEAIQAKLRACLSNLGPNDTALVYFSCHGFRDDKQKLYLAQIDCDPANPAPGGVPVAWLREQLAACRAKFKLLIIDACHGGSEKGEDEIQGVAAKDLAIPFRGLASVVTIASSQGDEKSLIWPEKRQSLFTYWVNQGLKGHADQNSNGEVTIDELYEFVYENVMNVAEQYFGRKQTPVRIIRSPGVPVVISLNPHTLKGMIEDMAEQLSTTMHLRGLTKVGIPEFTVDSGAREVLGGQFGSLGRYCAVELEGALAKKSGGKFDVVQHDALHEVLATKGFGVKDLRTSAVKDLTVDHKKIPVLAIGTLRGRVGPVVTAQCRLVGLKGQQTFGTAGGIANLDVNEWPMLGRSTATLTPAAPTVDNPTPTDSVDTADHGAKRPHPLLDPNFPFPVQIIVGKEKREGVFRGNDMFVPLRQGETYWIRIKNHDSASVLMRLLVDGRNTLPEKVKTKGVRVERKRKQSAQTPSRPTNEPTEERLVELPAQRVNLAEARYWFLDPKSTFGIRGFFSKLGKDGTYLEFKVTDAPASLSAREKFGEQLGMITVVFYAPQSRARSVGRGLMTTPGKAHKQRVRMYKHVPIGRQLAVVNIHYVTPEALDKLRDEKKPPVTQ